MHGAGFVPWDSTKMWALQFDFHLRLFLHHLIGFTKWILQQSCLFMDQKRNFNFEQVG